MRNLLSGLVCSLEPLRYGAVDETVGHGPGVNEIGQ
jgi:hypothetical protein